MAPRVSANIVIRAQFPTGDDATLSPTIIAGVVVAAVIAAGLAIWLGIRWYRKRASAKRTQRRASAFANFTGNDDMTEKRPLPSTGTDGTFSRNQLGANVVMPERAVLRPGASRDEILQHYTAEGKLPRPFAPFAPPGLAYDTSSDPGSPQSSARPASGASWLPPAFPLAGSRNSNSHSNRMSTMSVTSSIGSSGGASQKKIRQIFDPVLPDELVVSVGETLTVVQQYDDGWCIVGRDSVFTPGEVELGAIPAWCFLKPVKGLRTERPMRVSSLGVTVNLDPPPGFDQRENVMSWSNF